MPFSFTFIKKKKRKKKKRKKLAVAESYLRWRRATHRAAVWLAAVVARGHVSHLQHRDAAAVLRVAAIRTAEAPQAAEDPLDGGRVVA